MKGDMIVVDGTKGQIIKIVKTKTKAIATVEFYHGSRKKIDLFEYIWDDEKKVWKK